MQRAGWGPYTARRATQDGQKVVTICVLHQVCQRGRYLQARNISEKATGILGREQRRSAGARAVRLVVFAQIADGAAGQSLFTDLACLGG